MGVAAVWVIIGGFSGPELFRSLSSLATDIDGGLPNNFFSVIQDKASKQHMHLAYLTSYT